MPEFSFVIPCYGSERSIRDVVHGIDQEMRRGGCHDYEVIMVNDCSPDHTWDVLRELCDEADNRVCIGLTRNFGQHAALMAGFHYCTGKFVVTVDDDLQTPIGEFWNLKKKLDGGYDVVSASYRLREGFSLGRRISSGINRFMVKWLIGTPNNATVSVFMVARAFVIKEMIKYEQPYPYLPGLAVRATHNIANVGMDQDKRVYGKSGYSFRRLFMLWLDGFTAFSLKPLRVADFAGIMVAMFGFVMGAVIIVRKILNPDVLLGWSSIVSVILLVGGMVMVMLGLVGEYVGRIYMCMNHTPQYVVKEEYSRAKRAGDCHERIG